MSAGLSELGKHAKNILVVAVVFIVIDGIVLKSLQKHWNSQLTQIQGTGLKLNGLAAVLAYIVLVLGLYYFIILDKKSVLDAMLLGWLVYLTYEFTNKAIFNSWTWKTVLIDGLWGGLLFGITTYLFYRLHAILKATGILS